MRGVLAGVLAALLAAGASPVATAPPDPLQHLHVAGMSFHHPATHRDLARTLAEAGPRELARVARTLGLPAPQHVDVYLFPRRAELDPADWGLPGGPSWAAGLALSSQPVVLIRTDADVGPRGNEARTVLVHELVHVVTGQALGSRHAAVPAWLREGTASALAFEWRLTDAANATRLALTGRHLPLTQITHAFPEDAARAEMAYLEAFAFVSWLVEREGPDALAGLYQRLARGEDFATAFRAAYDASPRQLERQWRRGFLWTHRWIPILTGATTLWLGATGLFVVAWLRKRRDSRRRLAAWEVEEAAHEAASGPVDPG